MWASKKKKIKSLIVPLPRQVNAVDIGSFGLFLKFLHSEKKLEASLWAVSAAEMSLARASRH